MVYAFIFLVLTYIIVVKSYFNTFYILTSLFVVKAKKHLNIRKHVLLIIFCSILSPMEFFLLIIGSIRNCCFVIVKYKMVDHPGIVDYFSLVSLELLSTWCSSSFNIQKHPLIFQNPEGDPCDGVLL